VCSAAAVRMAEKAPLISLGKTHQSMNKNVAPEENKTIKEIERMKNARNI
jgi:hypothetical protein